MRISSVLLILAVVFAVPGLGRTQNSAPAGGTAPVGAQPASAKRPMTFEDMMGMKRLGDTAVSPDGKWLAYSVTTVDLEKNTKTAELWLQAIAGPASAGSSDRSPAPFKLGVGEPGDSGVQFAPDGKRILWISRREGGGQVWTADFDAATGATSNARKLTTIATDADNAKWSPDSKSIVFTSAVYPDCPAIAATDFATGNTCNADRDKAAAANPVKAQIFTQLLYRHWNHYTGEKRSHLFQVLVDGSGMRDLNPGDVHDVPPFSISGSGCGCDFSPDGKELAFTENVDAVPAISTSVSVFTLDLTNPAAKPVKVSTSAGGNFDPAYSPDGNYLAWRSQARAGYESDKFRLLVYDRQKKAIKDVLEDARLPNRAPAHFDLWVDEFAWSFTSTDSVHHILFVSQDQGQANIYETYLDGSELRRYSKTSGEWSDVHLLTPHSWPLVVGTLMHVDRPAEVVLGDLTKMDDDFHVLRVYSSEMNRPSEDITPKGYAPQQITHLNDALLAQLDLPKMESFWFTAADKTKLEGFIIRPPGFDAKKKYPVKFLIHGGPQGNWGDDWSYRWNAELFAANGYVVVMINPRGSTGYGQAIVDGVNGDWGGKPFTDLMEGLDYAEQHYPFIDKNRECALGASYGGYMADWVLGHTDRFRCIVSHDGMFNAESAFGTTEEDWFNIWEFRGHPWDYYGKPDAENPYRKWSPSLYAKNFKTPTLVVHGQLDYRLDVSEGFQLFDTLQMLGVPSKMLYFPDEGHWVLKPQNSELWWKTVNDWVDEWVKNSH
ncbi:MAG: S9 family peptidase [Terracidiphilus sp.]|jgi:dipeptidyl aminopeptidase/acylaminoacyl peptidase